MGNKIKFIKMQGIGNDYIYINCFEKNEIEINKIVRNVKKLSNRNFGIGSDGVILICKSMIADAKMRIFNADGSEARMCGNGIRCVGKFLYEKNIIKKQKMYIETLSGIRQLELNVEENKVKEISVDMGRYYVGKITKIKVNDKEKNVIPVKIGNYHLVIFEDNIEKINLEQYCRALNKSNIAKGANIEIVEKIDDKNVKMRVWENGSGETLACGTGASAVGIVYSLIKTKEKNINVQLRGGPLKINIQNNNKVYMTGGAEFVYEGEIEI